MWVWISLDAKNIKYVSETINLAMAAHCSG